MDNTISHSTSPSLSIADEALSREFHFFLSKPFNDKRKEGFYTSMSTMMNAGLNLKTALEIVIEEEKNVNLRTILAQLLQQMIQGKSLVTGMDTIPGITPYETKSVEIGEETGKLPEVFEQLANYYHDKVELKRKVTGAISYPVLILTMAIGMVAAMTIFLVPLYKQMYSQFGGELPAITKMLILVSDVVNEHWLGTCLALLCTVVFIRFAWKSDTVKELCQGLLIRIPVIGKLIQKVELSKFTRSISLLVSSGKPLVDSLNLTSGMTGFIPLAKSLKDAGIAVTKGSPLYQTLKNDKVFDKRITSYVRVGEEVGRLGSMFLTLSNMYQKEVNHQLTILTRMMEPALMLIVGAIVGFVVIALYLPMIGMGVQ